MESNKKLSRLFRGGSNAGLGPVLDFIFQSIAFFDGQRLIGVGMNNVTIIYHGILVSRGICAFLPLDNAERRPASLCSVDASCRLLRFAGAFASLASEFRCCCAEFFHCNPPRMAAAYLLSDNSISEALGFVKGESNYFLRAERAGFWA